MKTAIHKIVPAIPTPRKIFAIVTRLLYHYIKSCALRRIVYDKHMDFTTTTILILMVAGLAAGILSGLLGIGGGVIIIPVLVYVLGVNQKMAQGTTLAMMVPPIGIFAAMSYYKAGNVSIKAAVIMAAAFLIGGLVGAIFAHKIPTHILSRMFGLFVIILGIKQLFF
jgi:uncharacterized membrane protein YfcA